MIHNSLFLVLGSGIFFLMFFNMAICSYVAFSKLEQVESHLENCKLVERNRRVFGSGFFGRTYRLSQIGGMLIYPKILVRNGEANPEEIQKLPKDLRRWVVVPIGTGAMLFSLLVILWACGKHTGWLE